MLIKAKFKEAKFRELGKSEPVSSRRLNLRFNAGGGRRLLSNSESSNPLKIPSVINVGHIASNCPLKGRQSRESLRPN